ncbi:MAG: enoyl-ACP reductase [Chthonomonadales bacterium]
MTGKSVLVCGARNKWSIAWHCALSLLREDATVAFSVYSDREKDDVQKLLDGVGASGCPIFLCNATNQEDIDRMFTEVGAAFDGKLDGLVHGIAFAKRDDLTGEFVSTSSEGWDVALSSSAYTMVSLTRGARPLMLAAGGGSAVTLSYLGGERVVSGYNVMGVAKAALESSVRYLAADLGPENIRVNAVSAGPIKTLAASGIAGLSTMLKHVSEKSPLRRGVDADEVGDAVMFLLSGLARGITGEVLYVDAGYNIIGL